MTDEKRFAEIERKFKETESRIGKLIPIGNSSLSADMRWLIKNYRSTQEAKIDHGALTTVTRAAIRDVEDKSTTDEQRKKVEEAVERLWSQVNGRPMNDSDRINAGL